MNLRLLTEQIQELVGAERDGDYGIETAEKILQKLSPGIVIPIAVTDFVDERSEKEIATLQKEVQPYARALVHMAADHGVIIKVTSGTRTYDEQDELYKQGRTKPGRIVTNARGGYSNHNFGIAFDITIFNSDGPVWESPTYKAIGAWGKSLGLFWGGNWTSPVDEPHFELKPSWSKDLTERQMVDALRDRKENNKPIYV